jgi:uncharacterized protein YndB with AHSA1/START domain
MTASVHFDGDRLIATRDLDAAPALVWQALTTPEHLVAFWGGHHATILPDSVTVDLRVGGTFELETKGTDGSANALHFRYEVVEAPTRLVLTEPRTGITTEIRLQPTGSGTTVVIHQRRLPPELQTERARIGLGGILERLDAVARTIPSI